MRDGKHTSDAASQLCLKSIQSQLHGLQTYFAAHRWQSVTILAQKAYTWRLRVLPYMYTAFFDSHTYGCSIMRPLFFSFPGDQSTYYNDFQWMLGDALLVAPVLSQGTSFVSAYFPQGVWYSLYNYSMIDTSSAAQNVSLPVWLRTPFIAVPLRST